MRLVLDLGTSYAFRRPAVGIVRTERKFAEYLLSRDDIELAFCRLDRAGACFVEIDRERAEDIIRPMVPGPSDGVVSHPEAGLSQNVTLKARAKAATSGIASAVLGRLPESLQYDARTTLRAGKDFAVGTIRLAIGCIRSVGSRSKLTANGSPSSVEPFQFKSYDIYMSMGLDWDYNDLDLLAAERQRIGFKAVLFCYDTIPVQSPHLMASDLRQVFTDYFRRVARVADRVVAISETSKRDFLALMHQLGQESPGLDVVPLGTDLNVSEAAVKIPDPDMEGRPFVLFVSTIEIRKNHRLLYHVWERLVQRHGDRTPLLVFVGLIGWGIGPLVTSIRTNPLVKDRIRLFDNLGDEELTWLYRNCLFTVFPSFYEGWGLPVVESLALGKPCICSTAPGVVEASQGMATAVDPLDLPAWVAAVEHLWLDPEARDLATRRLQTFRAQTWREHGEALVAIARGLAG
jgi:glycosyltransferase involved in cell wall biosynthesis